MRRAATRIASIAIITGFAVLTGISSPASAATTPTVVYGFGGQCPPTHWHNPKVRPTRAYFDLACEGGIKAISWGYWRKYTAHGHGKWLVFNGFGFTTRPATITLSEVKFHNGHRYFSHMVINWVTRSGTHKRAILNWRPIAGLGYLWA
jgi:hypothetical protein